MYDVFNYFSLKTKNFPDMTRPSSAQPVGCAIDSDALSRARKAREDQLAMHALLFEILVYFVFLSIISSISYGSRDPALYYMKSHMMDSYVTYKTNTSRSFEQVIILH